MNKVTRNIFRIIISLVFIVVGLSSAIPASCGIIAHPFDIQIYAVTGLAFDIIMFLAGVLGLFRMKRTACIVFAVIIFVGFTVSAVTGLIGGASVPAVIFAAAKALVAWLYIGCVKK